jgi:hypothetical protein
MRAVVVQVPGITPPSPKPTAWTDGGGDVGGDEDVEDVEPCREITSNTLMAGATNVGVVVVVATAPVVSIAMPFSSVLSDSLATRAIDGDSSIMGGAISVGACPDLITTSVVGVPGTPAAAWLGVREAPRLRPRFCRGGATGVPMAEPASLRRRLEGDGLAWRGAGLVVVMGGGGGG